AALGRRQHREPEARARRANAREDARVERRDDDVEIRKFVERADDAAHEAAPVDEIVFHLDVQPHASVVAECSHVAQDRRAVFRRQLEVRDSLNFDVVHLRIVEDDDLAACAEAHVELDGVGALGERALERRERVLGGPGVTSPAAVSDDDEAASLEDAHADFGALSSSATSAAICFARATSAAGKLIAPTTGWPPPPKRSQIDAM